MYHIPWDWNLYSHEWLIFILKLCVYINIYRKISYMEHMGYRIFAALQQQPASSSQLQDSALDIWCHKRPHFRHQHELLTFQRYAKSPSSQRQVFLLAWRPLWNNALIPHTCYLLSIPCEKELLPRHADSGWRSFGIWPYFHANLHVLWVEHSEIIWRDGGSRTDDRRIDSQIVLGCPWKLVTS